MHQPRDRGYTAGLLHDVGSLALLSCFPAEYDNMLVVAHDHGFDQLECERQMFDIDHTAAGNWLARHWNLPEDLVAAIALHHEPSSNTDDIASIVRCADRLAGTLGFAMMEERGQPESREEILADLPLQDPEGFMERLEGVDDEIHNAINAFSPH